MSTEDVIGVVREHRWLSADKQAERLREGNGCRVILSLGGGKRLKQATWADLDKIARDGSIVRFVYAFLLGEPLRSVKAMRESFAKRMRALCKRDAIVEDLDSGLSTAEEGHKRALTALVNHMIGRSRQGAKSAHNGKKLKGRSLVEYSPQAWEEAYNIWRNEVDYETWEDVDDAFLALDKKYKHEHPFTRYRAARKWPGGRKIRKSKKSR